MFSFFKKASFFLIFIALLTSCMQEGLTSKPRPITITNKKAKQIQAKRYKRTESPRYDRRVISWNMISANKARRYSPMETRRYAVNNNYKNRKLNKHAVAHKRKKDNNYRYYRDSMEAHAEAEKTNFSIYDK